MEEQDSKKFLQSTIYTDYGVFFISTGHRRSSALLATDQWYYETFAWKMDEDNKTRLPGIIADNSGAVSSRHAIEQHSQVVIQLENSGKFKELS